MAAVLETGFSQALLTHAPLTALVDDRIRPIAPSVEDARPYVCYRVTADKSQAFLSGGVSEAADAEFEVEVYADDYDLCREIGLVVQRRLDQFGGVVSDVEFAPISYVNQSDIEETAFEGEEMVFFKRTLEFKALYELLS